jgi:hypothetical protein
LRQSKFALVQSRFVPRQIKFALGWIKLAPGQFKFGLNQTKSASGQSKFGLEQTEFASGRNIVVSRQTKFVSGQCKFDLVRYKLCFRECRVAMEGRVAWPGGSGPSRCKLGEGVGGRSYDLPL